MEVQREKKSTGYVSVGEKLSYSIASGGGNIITTIVGTFISAYLTDSVGIAAAAVGTMMLVIRFFNLGTDFVMGGIVDRTRTKYGKARPWLLLSAPMISLFLILLFSTPGSLSGAGKLAYSYVMYFLINAIGFTCFFIPHTSLLSRMTLNGLERQKIASMEQIINQVCALAVTTFWVPLVNGVGYRVTAIIYGVLAGVLILFGFFGTKEVIETPGTTEKKTQEDNVSLKTSAGYLIHNRYFWLETALFGLLLFHNMSSGTVMYYYCNNVLQNAGYVAVLSACGMIPAIVMNLLVPTFVKKFGKRRVLINGAIAIIITSVLMGMMSGSLVMIAILYCIKGFFLGSMFACAFALTGDVVDYGEWKFGVRSEGLVNAGVSIGQKAGLGFGPAVSSWIIGVGGYDGLAKTQSASALASINFSFTFLAAIIGAAILLVVIAMNLDKYMPQIQSELQKKHRQ